MSSTRPPTLSQKPDGAAMLATRCSQAPRSWSQRAADVVLGQVTGLAAFLDRLPAGQHEHVTDAAGHALLGLREMAEMRRMMGVAVP